MILALGIGSPYALTTSRPFTTQDTVRNDHMSSSQLASLAGKSKKSVKVQLDEADKPISNVKVFYNPVAEQISVTFKLDKDNNISIKVMDALGSEVMELTNESLDAGTQNLSFDTNSKLQPGIYFVRLTCGADAVIKRISIR